MIRKKKIVQDLMYQIAFSKEAARRFKNKNGDYAATGDIYDAYTTGHMEGEIAAFDYMLNALDPEGKIRKKCIR